MNSVLDRNLAALRRGAGELAERLRAQEAHAGVVWSESAQPPVLSAVVSDVDERGAVKRITLASRLRPADEAAKFAEAVNLADHAAMVVLGFGTGEHVRAVVERVRGKGMVIVYEPDAGLLRAVLERIDYSRMLGEECLTLLVGEVDESALVRAVEPRAAVVTQGVQIMTHTPTRQRQGAALNEFMARMTRVVAYCRTTVATTLVNSATTCRNLTANIVHYAAGDTVNELHGAAAGYPAVLVSAGPSLAKNVALLTEAGVRDRVVIIAVQTVLKPLLDRGVRPHFVTALDYHEISARFYEDLPPLPDVTLVAEPKAHRTIIDRYPGPVRVLQNGFLDRVLGEGARPIVPMRAGSTVAHLSLYLAWHLGCDPVMLIGQDLGFSDGLYYCPGTAIHDVWAPELGMFNTVEMMEWKRIARHKSHLQRRVDVHGRSIYSDEQMLTYLAQFERDFASSPSQVIDCTEGGLPKAHTTRMTLRQALEKFAHRTLPVLPEGRGAGAFDMERLAKAGAVFGKRMEQVRELRQVTQRTLPVLEAMVRDQRDHERMDRHFEELEVLRRRAAELGATLHMVNEANQLGVLKRMRADRAIVVDEPTDPYEKQARQLARDRQNLQWLIEGCDDVLSMFEVGRARIEVARSGGERERVAEMMEGVGR